MVLFKRFITFKRNYVLSDYTHSDSPNTEYENKHIQNLHDRFVDLNDDPQTGLSAKASVYAGFYDLHIPIEITRDVFNKTGVTNFVHNKWKCARIRQRKLLDVKLEDFTAELLRDVNFVGGQSKSDKTEQSSKLSSKPRSSRSRDIDLRIDSCIEAIDNETLRRRNIEVEELALQFALQFSKKEASLLRGILKKSVKNSDKSYHQVWAKFVAFHSANGDFMWKPPFDIHRNEVLEKIAKENFYMFPRIASRARRKADVSPIKFPGQKFTPATKAILNKHSKKPKLPEL